MCIYIYIYIANGGWALDCIYNDLFYIYFVDFILNK